EWIDRSDLVQQPPNTPQLNLHGRRVESGDLGSQPGVGRLRTWGVIAGACRGIRACTLQAEGLQGDLAFARKGGQRLVVARHLDRSRLVGSIEPSQLHTRPGP